MAYLITRGLRGSKMHQLTKFQQNRAMLDGVIGNQEIFMIDTAAITDCYFCMLDNPKS